MSFNQRIQVAKLGDLFCFRRQLKIDCGLLGNSPLLYYNRFYLCSVHSTIATKDCMKAEKYVITTEGGTTPTKIVSYGFGVAGEVYVEEQHFAIARMQAL